MKESKEVYFRNAKEQMKNLLNAEETLDLVEMKGCGYGSRHIAKLLGISKSSVNNYYKLWLKSQVAVSPEEQAEGQRLINRALYGTDYKPEDVAFKKSPLDNTPIPEAVFQEAKKSTEKPSVFQYLDKEVAKDMSGFYDALGMQPPSNSESKSRLVLADSLDKAVDEFGKPRLAKTLVAQWKRKSLAEQKKPRILFIDVESRPDTVVTFRRFKANIGLDNVLSEGGGLLSVAYAFDNEPVQGFALTPEQAIADDDSSLVATLWDAIEQCDFVVAHNLDKFDMALFKSRCVINGFSPPKRVKQIDTLKQAKQMKFQSNRLDALGQSLGEGSKIKHSGIQLWIDCMQGSQEALDEMLAYNIQDVELLRNVYHRLKSFDIKHPNAGIYTEGNSTVCRVCSSSNVSNTGNSIQAGMSLFEELICDDCGARSRVRLSNTSSEKRKSLLTI